MRDDDEGPAQREKVTDNVQKVGDEGSTYDPSANRPTNQPTTNQTTLGQWLEDAEIPVQYLSIRLTIAHEKWKEICEPCFDDAEWYISYPHSGKNGNNEHFHVFVNGCTAADRERYRKRFKKLGFVGNQHISVKLCENGVTSAITYGARESTQPITKGTLVQRWIDSAPAWVEQRAKSKKRARDEVIQLTCVNMMKLAFEFHRQNKVKRDELDWTLRLMLNSGEYVFAPTLVRQGAPIWYQDVFKESVKLGKLEWNPRYFSKGIFRDFGGRY